MGPVPALYLGGIKRPGERFVQATYVSTPPMGVCRAIMVMTPKAKAFTFAAALLLVSSIMVGTSIATTGSALRPFAAGEGYAEERSLTRGHHFALGIVVQEIVAGEL